MKSVRRKALAVRTVSISIRACSRTSGKNQRTSLKTWASTFASVSTSGDGCENAKRNRPKKKAKTKAGCADVLVRIVLTLHDAFELTNRTTTSARPAD